jgi:hypothetical protein
METPHVTRTASPGMAATAPRSLKPALLDADAIADANRLADDWRATGLAVDLGELPSGAGYALTARSPTRTLRCECRRWSRRGALLAGGRVWTIAVTVGRADGEAARPAGVAAADTHEAAWRQVLAWIDGRGRLEPDLTAAVGEAPRVRSGRLAAAVLATFAAGFGAGLLFFLLAGWW